MVLNIFYGFSEKTGSFNDAQKYMLEKYWMPVRYTLSVDSATINFSF
jgi:hypothetical protein